MHVQKHKGIKMLRELYGSSLARISTKSISPTVIISELALHYPYFTSTRTETDTPAQVLLSGAMGKCQGAMR